MNRSAWRPWRLRRPHPAPSSGREAAPSSGREAAAPPDLVVHVYGERMSVEALTRALPPGWVAVHPPAEPAEGRLACADLVVMVNESASAVRSARARRPAVRLLAVVREDADVGAVVGILDAGADACVRGEHPAMVAAHLVALHRRGEPGRGAA